MPSSPERPAPVSPVVVSPVVVSPAAPVALQLAELGPQTGTSAAPLRPAAFTATHVAAAPQAPVFQVAAGAGIPDDLLAAARRRAESAGYLAGWSHGVAAARQHTEADVALLREQAQQAAARAAQLRDAAVAAVEQAAAALARREVLAAHELEDLIVSSALDIAEALVGQVLRDVPARSAAALARVLDLVPAGGPVEVRLHPDDHAVLTEDGPAGSDTVVLVADASLAPGDAVAVTGTTTVDARIADALARVRSVLGR